MSKLPVRPPPVQPPDDDYIEVVLRVPRTSLAALLGAVAVPTAAFYDSRSNPPPGRSAAAFAASCRTGAHPTARKSGRVWIVERDAYHHDIEQTPKTKAKPLAIAPPPPVDDAATLLESVGFRLRDRKGAA